jgi:hypothetical protein
MHPDWSAVLLEHRGDIGVDDDAGHDGSGERRVSGSAQVGEEGVEFVVGLPDVVRESRPRRLLRLLTLFAHARQPTRPGGRPVQVSGRSGAYPGVKLLGYTRTGRHDAAGLLRSVPDAVAPDEVAVRIRSLLDSGRYRLIGPSP